MKCVSSLYKYARTNDGKYVRAYLFVICEKKFEKSLQIGAEWYIMLFVVTLRRGRIVMIPMQNRRLAIGKGKSSLPWIREVAAQRGREFSGSESSSRNRMTMVTAPS